MLSPIWKCLEYNIIWQGKWNFFFIRKKSDYIWTMSFSSQRIVCYLIDQFNNWLLILYIKTSIMFKRQLFDNSNNEKRTLRVYKCPQIKKGDNEKQDLDKYEGEVNRYIPFLPVPPPPPQQKSNRLSNLDDRTRSLTHLICIPKTTSQRITNFALEFLGKKGLKPKKKNLYKPLKRWFRSPLIFHYVHSFRHHQLPLLN